MNRMTTHNVLTLFFWFLFSSCLRMYNGTTEQFTTMRTVSLCLLVLLAVVSSQEAALPAATATAASGPAATASGPAAQQVLYLEAKHTKKVALQYLHR